MATTLAATRTAAYDAVDQINANRYRRLRTDYNYPAIVIGWPDRLDVRPTMGDARDFVLSVHVGVEVTDEESSDDLLSNLLEEVVARLEANDSWDVQPVTDFGAQQTNDERVVLWCRIPLAVYS